MDMDEVKNEYTAKEGVNARIPAVAHRREANPGECGSLPVTQ
jgi:hypothetical protein